MKEGKVLIEIEDLIKTYSGGTEALRGINMKVYKGEFLVIVGSSGAGKSTLLRCINGLTQLTSGKISVDGVEVDKLSKKELRKLRKNLGMIFQSFNIVPRKRVLDNVLHGLLADKGLKGVFGLFSREEKEQAFKILDTLGLANEAVKRADQLSGGQKQRVGIARALMQNPKAILADEPVASLDPGSSDKVLGYMSDICKSKGITSIVSLHQINYARQYADRIIGLTNGEVTFEGKPDDLNDEAVRTLYFDDDEEVS